MGYEASLVAVNLCFAKKKHVLLEAFEVKIRRLVRVVAADAVAVAVVVYCYNLVVASFDAIAFAETGMKLDRAKSRPPYFEYLHLKSLYCLSDSVDDYLHLFVIAVETIVAGIVVDDAVVVVVVEYLLDK